MSVTVAIPTPLRNFTGGRDAVDVAGSTVGEVLDGLLTTHGGLKRHLVQDDGRLRNFVNLYLNDTDIRQLESTATPVREGDVAGGVGGEVVDARGVRTGAGEQHGESDEERARQKENEGAREHGCHSKGT